MSWQEANDGGGAGAADIFLFSVYFPKDWSQEFDLVIIVQTLHNVKIYLLGKKSSGLSPERDNYAGKRKH